MSNVIFIRNTGVEILSGERKRDGVRVDFYDERSINEDAMVNGVIFDDSSIKEVISQFKTQYEIEEATLILDSNKILTRQMVIPKLKPKQIIEHLKGTFEGLYDGDDTLIYDYAYLVENEEVKGSSQILGVAVEKGFIETYINLFEECEIELGFIDFSTDVLIRLKEFIPGLIDASYAIVNIDGTNISSSVFSKGNYMLTTRSKIFSDPSDTSAFGADVTRAISQLQQFANNAQNNAPFDVVYFTGISREQGDEIFERIQNVIGLEAKLLPTPRGVYAENDEVIGLNNHLYTLGYLIGE
jgi:Tfp pilus assembly PilM family ATPase